LKRLKIADQYSEFIGIPPPKTNLRLAQQAAVKYYATGVREFSRVFAELDKYKLKGQDGEIKLNPEKLEDDLATWLEGMRLEDGTMEETFHCGGSSSRPEVIFDSLSLYRCSWCGNPSAALKKCEHTVHLLRIQSLIGIYHLQAAAVQRRGKLKIMVVVIHLSLALDIVIRDARSFIGANIRKSAKTKLAFVSGIKLSCSCIFRWTLSFDPNIETFCILCKNYLHVSKVKPNRNITPLHKY
jgi:hypothetical protein